LKLLKRLRICLPAPKSGIDAHRDIVISKDKQCLIDEARIMKLRLSDALVRTICYFDGTYEVFATPLFEVVKRLWNRCV